MNLGKNNLIIFGAQWGDEGKGKIVDLFSKSFDFVVRFNGGPNAGHTVENKRGKIVLHQLPTGILNERCTVVLSPGVVLDLEKLKNEIREVVSFGINVKGRIKISNRCHVILSLHKILDGMAESVRGNSVIGTTRSGIGPVYGTKASYLGVRIEDLFDPPLLKEKLRILSRFYSFVDWKWEEEFEHLTRLAIEFKPFVTSTERFLLHVIESKKVILFEGAQGILLDNNFGTYPYCTASLCSPSSAIVNSGIPFNCVKNALGVGKCYVTRVGQGPMPSEIEDPDLASRIRELGNEYGATTGRQRRVGWLDLPALKYALKISGANMLIITKLDILARLPEFKVVESYRLNGKRVDFFDASISELFRIQTKLKNFRSLNLVHPKERELINFGKNFCKFIEEQTEVRVVGFSYSPRTEDFYHL